MNFKWNLNESNFTWLDRLKICKFFLSPRNRWTQGNYVFDYENRWRDYVGSRYALCVSSGSTANALIAQYAATKDLPNKDIVVFPSVTWQTSVSPWLNFGFKPKFIDVNLEDFSLDLEELELFLKKEHSRVSTVFITSLIGVTPDINKAKSICSAYNVDLKLDNCENSFGSYGGRHICSEHTSSTSLYFGHQTTTGSEGGVIFTNSEEEMSNYILNRSHGLTRELLSYDLGKSYHKKLSNSKVDKLFDFNTLGSNYRMSNIAAYMGLLDFKRVKDYTSSRKLLYQAYSGSLSRNEFILPTESEGRENIMFCLPVILKVKNKARTERIKKLINELNIEYRPIISGNLLRQTCYKNISDYRNFRNAEHLHNYGIYVGLHPKLKINQVNDLADALNKT